jgi:citrate lyase alpha subunit
MSSNYKPSLIRRPFHYFNFSIREYIKFIVKGAMVIAWLMVFLLALLEVKRYYNIDVIPGYNSSVDDAYGAARGTITGFFR